MPLHLIKLCVGADSIDDLVTWWAARVKAQRRGRQTVRLFHATSQTPKRAAELVDGGSLYWVIKGVIQARQKLIAIEEGVKADGTPCCHLVLDLPVVAVRPTPRRAFQGWRYLEGKDAPADLKAGVSDSLSAMPAKMRKELADLGLI